MNITTQKQLRTAFWESSDFQRIPGATQNDYPTDIRVAWCDFVDSMRRDGKIAENLADRATL